MAQAIHAANIPRLGPLLVKLERGQVRRCLPVPGQDLRGHDLLSRQLARWRKTDRLAVVKFVDGPRPAKHCHVGIEPGPPRKKVLEIIPIGNLVREICHEKVRVEPHDANPVLGNVNNRPIDGAPIARPADKVGCPINHPDWVADRRRRPLPSPNLACPPSHRRIRLPQSRQPRQQQDQS